MQPPRTLAPVTPPVRPRSSPGASTTEDVKGKVVAVVGVLTATGSGVRSVGEESGNLPSFLL
jgi:hypothetical protein